MLEKQGTTTLFSQTHTLNDNGTRASSAASQLQPDGSTVTTATVWTYDGLSRLTGEAVTSSQPGQSYSDAYAYDLESNRTSKLHAGPGGGANESVWYVYNGDDELTSQTSSLSGTTIKGYDANGSLTTSILSAGPGQATYTYDARNKLVGYAGGGTTLATYVYDNAGDRVSEIAGGVTTQYLTDTQNPTGYDQPLEANAPTATATYILGDRVLGQADGSASVSYLLVDGHGSTQALTSAAGAVTQTFRYDAFGTALNFTTAAAGTIFLFGGDAVFDPISGLYFHGNGVRPRSGFVFVERDTYQGARHDPLSLHKYLYAGSQPANRADPTGRYATLLLGGADDLVAYSSDAAVGAGAEAQASALVSGINAYEQAQVALADSISDINSQLFGKALQAVLGQAAAIVTALATQAFEGDSRGVAEGIANGHAGESVADGGHLEEFEDLAIYDPGTLADLIDAIISETAPQNIKRLPGDRTGYLDPETGTVVVLDPNSPDGGTAYRPEYGNPPRDPQEVFDNLK